MEARELGGEWEMLTSLLHALVWLTVLTETAVLCDDC